MKKLTRFITLFLVVAPLLAACGTATKAGGQPDIRSAPSVAVHRPAECSPADFACCGGLIATLDAPCASDALIDHSLQQIEHDRGNEVQALFWSAMSDRNTGNFSAALNKLTKVKASAVRARRMIEAREHLGFWVTVQNKRAREHPGIDYPYIASLYLGWLPIGWDHVWVGVPLPSQRFYAVAAEEVTADYWIKWVKSHDAMTPHSLGASIR